MNTYRIEFVSPNGIGDNWEDEFTSLLEAAKWADAHFGINNEILSITKI